VLLSWATGSVSSGNLSAFDVIGSKAREIAGDDIVTIGNEQSCPWQRRRFNSKPHHQSTAAPYSTDNVAVELTN